MTVSEIVILSEAKNLTSHMGNHQGNTLLFSLNPFVKSDRVSLFYSGFDKFYILNRGKLVLKYLARMSIPEGGLFVNRLKGWYATLPNFWLLAFFF